MLFIPRLKSHRLLVVATIAVFLANCPQYCSTLKNPFYGLTLHGTIGLGVKPMSLSETKTSHVAASSSLTPHYHYPFGSYHPNKARYPSASINQDGRYVHLLSKMRNGRSRSDDSSVLGYRPVKHYLEKSNYESGMDFLINLLGGGSELKRLEYGTSYNRPRPRNYSSSSEWTKEFSSSASRLPLGSQGSKGHHDGRESSPYDHSSPFRPSPVDPEFNRLSPFVSYSPASSGGPDFPSLYQHPLMQIVPLLVIEKRHRIRPPKHYGPPRPPPPNWGYGPHEPNSLSYFPNSRPPPFDHPHHHQHPQFKNSKINFPIDDAPLPPELRFTTSKFQQFPTEGGNGVKFNNPFHANVAPHLRPFIVQEPVSFPHSNRRPFREKNIFPKPIIFENNNEASPNYDSDYPDIITANNAKDEYSRVKFPDEPSSFIDGGDNSLFSNPSFRNSHQYSPTTGPDQDHDLLELSPLLIGEESKPISEKVANSTSLSLSSGEGTNKTEAILERRNYYNVEKGERQSKNTELLVGGQYVTIPEFTPIPPIEI